MAKFLILGVPRSGTSMLTGLFHGSGVYCGPKQLPPTISNPQGYFESHEINSLNNCIIHKLVSWPVFNGLIRRRYDLITNLDQRGYAFASPRFLRPMPLGDDLKERMRTLLSRADFCYKDPRFCVTLPSWRPFLPNGIKVLVVFREPEKTVESYLKNVDAVYHPPFHITQRELDIAYARNYSRLLQWADSNWSFYHYDQIYSGEAKPKIEKFSGIEMTWSHVNESLRRSQGYPAERTSMKARLVYKRLCKLAMHRKAP